MASYDAFHTVGEGISFFDNAQLSDPSEAYLRNKVESDMNDPEIIILLTWVAAAPHHIAKYTEKYARMYPKTSILLVTSSLYDMMGRTTSSEQNRFQPAVELLKSCTKLSTDPKNPRVLLHMFSNGGAHSFSAFARSYKHATSETFPAKVMVLDSTPGRGTYGRSLAAIVLSLPPSAWIRIPGRLLAHIVLSNIWLSELIFNTTNVVNTARQDLNDPNFLANNIPRLYFYSEADKMVNWKDIEDHAESAKELGWPIEMVKFNGTEHVHHMRNAEDTYWNSISQIWSKL